MRFILKASANYYYKNLLISDEVAIIILNKYSDISFYNIVFIKRYTPNKQL